MRSKSKPVKLQALQSKKKLKIQAEEFRPAKHEAQSTQQTAEKTPPQSQKAASELYQENLNKFEKIKDLYENLYGWRMLIRVMDTSYKQFTSKAGHFTKILTVDMIDNCGNTITGKFFGQSATLTKDLIKTGKVYLVSKGRVVEERGKYVKNSSSKLSILFNTYSQFQEVEDFGTIPETKKWMNISEALKLTPSEQTYSFVGILLTISEEKIFKKGEKQMVLQTFQVGDPIGQEMVQCSVWDRQINLDQSLQQKSVLLKHFRVHVYHDKVSLLTTFRSEIVPHQIFQKYQFQPTKYQRSQKNVTLISLKNLYEQTQKAVENVTSHVQARVAFIGFNQKWFYQACPKCSKACSSNTKCIYCSLDVEETIKRFMLAIELADSTGSISVTAFNESAAILLKGSKITELLQYDPKQLLEFGFEQSFDEFRIQILSKKDKEGRLIHNIVGEPIPVNIQQASIRNLSKICVYLKQFTLFPSQK